MTTWFTSDTHFGHANIIKFCARPFKHVDEMNEELISRWNNKVKPSDVIYHLGDFSFDKNPANVIRRLNGNIHLIRGNHDKDSQVEAMKPWLRSVRDCLEFKISAKESVWLSHYPHRSWPRSYHGSYHLYGHVHGNMPGIGRSMDVGVDSHDYSPISLEQVVSLLKNKKFNEH